MHGVTVVDGVKQLLSHFPNFRCIYADKWVITSIEPGGVDEGSCGYQVAGFCLVQGMLVQAGWDCRAAVSEVAGYKNFLAGCGI